jgi:hypothetical protein
VVCSVPRSPLAVGATSGSFYVDGDNFSGATTSCTLYSYNYDGTYLGSVGFSAAELHFDRLVTLPAAQLSMWAYVYMECAIPGNQVSQIRGVTSVQ